MRRGWIALAAAVAVVAAGPASADTPAATAQPTAPLTVTFRAAPGAASYHWGFGDGTTGEGDVVEHAYARPGRYDAVLTTEAGATHVAAVAYRLTFEGPARAGYGTTGRFTGSIWPAVARARIDVLGPAGIIAHGKTRANGGFALFAKVRGRGPFRARVIGLLSAESSVFVRPQIEARLAGSGVVGTPLRLVARLVPAAAGTLTATIRRNGRVTYSGPLTKPFDLRTGAPGTFRVKLVTQPAEGYLRATRVLRATVLRPSFQFGSRGDGVRALQRRLLELHYALPTVDGVFELATFQAVLAFQAVEGLLRTGRVDVPTWRRLTRAGIPRPRYPGTHLEVSKGRQVLYAVRDGQVDLVVHVSTGATGNTPIGHWHIYRKVSGWDWVLWYPMYFLRGFAIHGYPDVPAYPASHGCVRVPMWVATRLFSGHSLGESVYLYW